MEAYKAWCRRYGNIFTTADLSRENIGKLFQNRMRWFGLENEVMTFETARRQILFSDQIGSRRKLGLLQYTYDLEEGKSAKVSSRTASEYNRTLRDLAMGPMREQSKDQSITRLDIETGTEILVA